MCSMNCSHEYLVEWLSLSVCLGPSWCDFVMFDSWSFCVLFPLATLEKRTIVGFLWVRSQPPSRKDETEKFSFVFVELTLLLVYCQAWGMKSAKCGVKSSVMFGLTWTKTNDVIWYISCIFCTGYACNDLLNGVLEHFSGGVQTKDKSFVAAQAYMSLECCDVSWLGIKF